MNESYVKLTEQLWFLLKYLKLELQEVLLKKETHRKHIFSIIFNKKKCQDPFNHLLFCVFLKDSENYCYTFFYRFLPSFQLSVGEVLPVDPNVTLPKPPSVEDQLQLHHREETRHNPENIWSHWELLPRHQSPTHL